MISFVAGILALFFVFGQGRGMAAAASLASGAAALALIALKFKLDYEVRGEKEVVIELEYLGAYWGAFLLFALSCGLNWHRSCERTAGSSDGGGPKS